MEDQNNKNLEADVPEKEEVVEVAKEVAEEKSETAISEPKKSIPKKAIIIGAIALAIVVTTLLIILLVGKKDKPDTSDDNNSIVNGDTGSSGNSGSNGNSNASSGSNNNSTQAAHTHTYNQQNTASKYLCSYATCSAQAKYYYSCECGEKGTTTFGYGDLTAHSINSRGSCDHCGYSSPYYSAIYEENERHNEAVEYINFELSYLAEQEDTLLGQLSVYGIYSLSSLSSSDEYSARKDTLTDTLNDKRTQLESFKIGGHYTEVARLEAEIAELDDEYTKCCILYECARDAENFASSYSFWNEQLQNENLDHNNNLLQIESQYADSK